MRPRDVVRPGGQDRDAAAPGHAGGEPGQLGRVPVGEIPGDHGSGGAPLGRLEERVGLAIQRLREERPRRDSRARASLLRRAIAREIRLPGGEFETEPAQQVGGLAEPPERAAPAGEGDARPSFVALRAEDRDHPDLTRPGHVSPPAGRPVEPLHLDHPHFPVHVGGLRSGNSIARSGGTTWVRTGRSSQTTAPVLDAPEEVRVRARVIHVDRHHCLAEMERASVGPRDLDERPREDVLPRVLLHVIKAPRPVHQLDARARRERALQHVPDCLTLERDLGHRHPAPGRPGPRAARLRRGRTRSRRARPRGRPPPRARRGRPRRSAGCRSLRDRGAGSRERNPSNGADEKAKPENTRRLPGRQSGSLAEERSALGRTGGAD